MYHNIIFTKFKERFVYRSELLGGLLNSFIGLVAIWFIWNAIYTSAGVTVLEGVTLPAMITYLSISMVIRIYSHSYTEYIMHDEIKHGGIAVIITKPINYILFVLSREIGNNIFNFLVRGVPILLVSFLILNITLTQSLLPFLISFILGFFVNFFIIILVGLWSFWAGTIWGIRYSKNIISELTSGAVIPLFLFPLWFQQIAQLLPFQSIYNIPLSIYIGKIAGFGVITSILTQVFWIVFLGILTLFSNCEATFSATNLELPSIFFSSIIFKLTFLSVNFINSSRI